MIEPTGPLRGIRVIEFAGQGPGPFAAMMLSDLGAEVIRIDRKDGYSVMPTAGTKYEVDARGRRSLTLDLKQPAATEIILTMAEQSDAILEGFRPGVMERLGLGPAVMMARNPRLVYGRMTGWGQEGPYALAAGHDVNYIAISGALHMIGSAEQPVPPVNFVGDYAGALVMVIGILAGIHNVREGRPGQVVDTAISDVGAYLTTAFQAMVQSGHWHGRRATNSIDGGAPYYGVYRCADGEWISVGSIEPKFYAALIEKTGLPERFLTLQNDRGTWPELREALTVAFAGKTRAEWYAIMAGTDVCFGPVLSLADAPSDPHNIARGVFVTSDGVVQPGPTPRFSETPGNIQGPPSRPGQHSEEILQGFGFDAGRITELKNEGVI
jgi:alpha-methylacyl-CoA racemase